MEVSPHLWSPTLSVDDQSHASLRRAQADTGEIVGRFRAETWRVRWELRRGFSAGPAFGQLHEHRHRGLEIGDAGLFRWCVCFGDIAGAEHDAGGDGLQFRG